MMSSSRNAKHITFSVEMPTGVGNSFVGIYDWTNGNSSEIWWDVSDPSKNPRILGIMVYISTTILSLITGFAVHGESCTVLI